MKKNQASPERGTLWERKRDKLPVKVDRVKKGVVTYTTIHLLEQWDTPLETWAKNFRPWTPVTVGDQEAADHCPLSRED